MRRIWRDKIYEQDETENTAARSSDAVGDSTDLGNFFCFPERRYGEGGRVHF